MLPSISYNMRDEKKRKILNIDNIKEITNSKTSNYPIGLDPNQIGEVIEKDTNKKLSEITPLIMVINQSANNCDEKVKKLIELGGDIYMKINYYGKQTSASDIIKAHRPKLLDIINT